MWRLRPITYALIGWSQLCPLSGWHASVAAAEERPEALPLTAAEEATAAAEAAICDADRVYSVAVYPHQAFVKVEPMTAGLLDELTQKGSWLLLLVGSGSNFYQVALEFQHMEKGTDLYVFTPTPKGSDEAMEQLRSAQTLQFSTTVSCQTFQLQDNDEVCVPQTEARLPLSAAGKPSNIGGICKPDNPRVFRVANTRL